MILKEKRLSPEGCRIEKGVVRSALMGRDIGVVVVLPPAARDEAAGPFPVLYALHGMGAPFIAWSEMRHLRQALAGMPMMVVSFNGDPAGWYLDSPRVPESQFRTFFFEELVPAVENRYKTTGQRAVTGFSMGGFGAFYYTFSDPDFFASASSLSGSFRDLGDWSDYPPVAEALERLLGPLEANPDAYRALDLRALLKDRLNEGKTIPPLMLRCGIEESLLPVNRSFVDYIATCNADILETLEKEVGQFEDPLARRDAWQRLRNEHLVDFTYVETNGGHDWPYWLGQSRAIIEFHWRHFQD